MSAAEQEKGVGAGSASDLDWLLDDLVARVPDVDKAVILSRDGLAIAASSALTREDAEHLAAVAAGFQSLARGAGRHFGGGLRPADHRGDGHRVPVRDLGRRGQLPGRAGPASADAGLVAYEMAMLVKRVGQHLSVNPRPVPAGEVTG